MIFEKKIGGADSAPPPNGSHPAKQPNVTRVKVNILKKKIDWFNHYYYKKRS